MKNILYHISRQRKGMWISIPVICILIPLTLALGKNMSGRKYYIVSVLIMVYAMVPFFAGFESRRPQARELVTIAVMSAIAAASRAAFVMIPQCKPIIGIIIISGMAFGAEAGFLTGALGTLVSNFLFGQGPWTPWQMFAYGISGFLAGIFTAAGFLRPERRIRVTIFGVIVTLCIVGPMLDTCTLFLSSAIVQKQTAAAVYLAGLPVNAVLAAATGATLFFLEKPMMEKLTRLKTKYAMMHEMD